MLSLLPGVLPISALRPCGKRLFAFVYYAYDETRR
jgi:hypothetical protein